MADVLESSRNVLVERRRESKGGMDVKVAVVIWKAVVVVDEAIGVVAWSMFEVTERVVTLAGTIGSTRCAVPEEGV